VFLGPSAADHDTARAAFGAGATGVTHLFNAMSGLHHRAPGLAAAALEDARFLGLIADGHHVHPAAMRLAARSRPEAIFLVSDAMAVAGTRADGFHMEADWIARRDGRLTRADGTLAGADLDMAAATRTYADATGLDWHTALRAAFDTPYRVLTGRPNRIRPGARARLLVWQGRRLVGPLPD